MSTVRSRHAYNGRTRLHLLESGHQRGDRPPIVFVPGMSCMANDYAAMLPQLGRHAIAVDLRGQGGSETPDSGYSLEERAHDIEAAVHVITSGPVHLMTFSRGTCYAIRWAADNADRVLSVSIGDYPAREIGLDREAQDRFVNGRWRGTPVRDRIAEHAARQVFSDAVDRPLWGELATVAAPLLVVRSGASSPLTDTDWDRFHQEWPTAELVQFNDSPHDIFRPDRLRYAHLVRELADRTDAARSLKWTEGHQAGPQR